MKSLHRKLALAAAIAAGAAAIVPAVAQADAPGHYDKHYIALNATQSTYSVQILNQTESSPSDQPITIALQPGKTNRSTLTLVQNSETYQITCFDVNKQQIGNQGTFTPISDGLTWWYVNLYDACGLNN